MVVILMTIVDILLMDINVITLVAIGGYYINGY
jgi:hypothetical protein